jgi:hypothetical protein
MTLSLIPSDRYSVLGSPLALTVVVDEIRGGRFDFPDQFRQCHVGSHPDQHVKVIRHPVNRDQLLFPVSHDAGDVLVEFFFEAAGDETCPAADGEDDLNVDLRVCVSHTCGTLLRS